MKNAHKHIIGKHEGMTPLRTRIQVDNSAMDLKQIRTSDCPVGEGPVADSCEQGHCVA
jgi:hypothetical protein